MKIKLAPLESAKRKLKLYQGKMETIWDRIELAESGGKTMQKLWNEFNEMEFHERFLIEEVERLQLVQMKNGEQS